MQDKSMQDKSMPQIDENLYFIIDEKNKIKE